MRAMVVDAHGPIETLHEGEVPIPSPGPEEVRVRMRASCANHADIKALTGDVKLMHAQSFPMVVGYDLSGVVDAVGDGVTDLSVGDPVFGHLAYARGTELGTYVEYTVAPAASLAIKPDGVSHVTAAAAATAGLTALQALRDKGDVKAGSRVLVIGASGGVGSLAVGVAGRLGGHVTGVCSGPSVDFVRSLGADEVIDRGETDLVADSGKYDVVFDVPSAYTFATWSKRLNPGGTYVCTLPSISYITGKIRALLSRTSCRLVVVKPKRKDLEQLGGWLTAGLEVPIDSTYPLERVADALLRLQRGGMKGRVAITF